MTVFLVLYTSLVGVYVGGQYGRWDRGVNRKRHGGSGKPEGIRPTLGVYIVVVVSVTPGPLRDTGAGDVEEDEALTQQLDDH